MTQDQSAKFAVSLSSEDLAAIRAAIQAWGKPSEVASGYSESRLRQHLATWNSLVQSDWEGEDPSEYDHDIGCRFWIQVAIEHSAPTTAEIIATAARPADEAFKRRMTPVRTLSKYRVPVLRGHPYFWDLNTLHPELARETA